MGLMHCAADPAKVIERSSPRGHAARTTETTYYIHYTECV